MSEIGALAGATRPQEPQFRVFNPLPEAERWEGGLGGMGKMP